MSAIVTDRTQPAPSVSAVLPAYNEEVVIERSVRQLARVLSSLAPDFEIIVTDDGSQDRTGEILARLAEHEPELCLRVVTHEHNQGYGAALASGFDAAVKDLVFFTDGDKQFDAWELTGLLPAIEPGVDLVIGWFDKDWNEIGHWIERPTRATAKSAAVRAVTVEAAPADQRDAAVAEMRELLAADPDYYWGWKQLVNCLFGYTARDVDCAFKLFRRRVWQSLTVRSRGATFSAEFLIKARRLGFSVVELPVNHYPRTGGSPTGARPAVIARAFKELFQLWWSLDRDLARDPRAAAMLSSPRPLR
jgi:glycosyltransferase involved in cell wall biosynthesis